MAALELGLVATRLVSLTIASGLLGKGDSNEYTPGSSFLYDERRSP